MLKKIANMLKKVLFVSLFFHIFNATLLFSQDYDEWINRSFDYIDKDSLPQAEECLKKAMRLEPANPRNGMLFVNLGTLQRQQGEYKEAETSYSCAIALLSDVPKIRVNRAELYAEMNRFNEAIDDYTLLLETEPHNEDWLYRRALCKLMATDTIGAQEDLQFIDSFNPKSAKSRLGMAVIYKAQGQYSMAEELYNALLKANPESWSLLRDRAEVYFLSNRSGAALMDINKAIEKNPQDPMSYLLRAQIRFQKGDIEYGKRDLKTAIEKGLSPEIVSPLMQKYP